MTVSMWCCHSDELSTHDHDTYKISILPKCTVRNSCKQIGMFLNLGNGWCAMTSDENTYILFKIDNHTACVQSLTTNILFYCISMTDILLSFVKDGMHEYGVGPYDTSMHNTFQIPLLCLHFITVRSILQPNFIATFDQVDKLQ